VLANRTANDGAGLEPPPALRPLPDLRSAASDQFTPCPAQALRFQGRVSFSHANLLGLLLSSAASSDDSLLVDGAYLAVAGPIWWWLPWPFTVDEHSLWTVNGSLAPRHARAGFPGFFPRLILFSAPFLNPRMAARA